MLRVNIEGEKYTIVCDEKGDVRIERYGKPWLNEPECVKAWISVAYELACLRRVAKAAIALTEYADKGDDKYLHGHIGALTDVIRRCDGLTDIRRNLDNPGEV